ncbi:MAG: RIO1 family regulatory kinase/ATPase [Candidatus Limnocylindrales bacterium]
MSLSIPEDRAGSAARLAPIPRPAPSWLVDAGYQDHHLGVLRSGKEAEVFLIERRAADRSCLLAHKRYRPRNPAPGELLELGFSKGTLYRNDAVYRRGWHLRTRDQRAVERGTEYGHQVTAQLWPVNELAMLRRAWEAGAAVPYPVEPTEDGLLMEFVGDASLVAAPRLVNAGLDRQGLVEAWEQLLGDVRRLARAHVVHADLSAYNLLWWQDRVVIIDFPQAVDAITNPAAPDLLHRDIVNVTTWFGRHGLALDAEALFATLVTDLF